MMWYSTAFSGFSTSRVKYIAPTSISSPPVASQSGWPEPPCRPLAGENLIDTLEDRGEQRAKSQDGKDDDHLALLSGFFSLLEILPYAKSPRLEFWRLFAYYRE
jgi:hypothetical protein